MQVQWSTHGLGNLVAPLYVARCTLWGSLQHQYLWLGMKGFIPSPLILHTDCEHNVQNVT